MDTELQELIDCCNREDDLQGVMPFITAIRIQFGPAQSAKVFQKWCDDNAYATRGTN